MKTVAFSGMILCWFLKVIYKGFLNSCIVLYASETYSSNHYVENRIRKFQLVHNLQRCFSSHYLFSCKDNLPGKINNLSKVLPSRSFDSILKQRENQSYKLCFHCTLWVFLVKMQFFQCSSVRSQLNS